MHPSRTGRKSPFPPFAPRRSILPLHHIKSRVSNTGPSVQVSLYFHSPSGHGSFDDPTAIAEVTLTGLNCPARIGGVTVLPGDVVLGTPSGLIFIPPHLAQEVVEDSELVRLQDRWGQMRLREGRYLPGQVDGAWTDEMRADFEEWRQAL